MMLLLFSAIFLSTTNARSTTLEPLRAYPNEECQRVYAVITFCQTSQPETYTDEEQKRLVQLTNLLRAFASCRQEKNIDCPDAPALLQMANWFMRPVDAGFQDAQAEFEDQKIQLYARLDEQCKACIEQHKVNAIYKWCPQLETFPWEQFRRCYSST